MTQEHDLAEVETFLLSLPPIEAAELREFMGRPARLQNAYVYHKVTKLDHKIDVATARRPLRERLYDFGMVGAFLAYVLLDRGKAGDLPWPK